MLTKLSNLIQASNDHPQNLVEYDDYQIIMKELLRLRNTRNKLQLQKEEDSQSLVRINISLQKSNDSLKECMAELEKELEYYKHQYTDYKALYETEAGRYNQLAVEHKAVEVELAKTKSERDHAEMAFIEKQKEIEGKIAQYDNLILAQLETNKKAEKRLERAKLLLNCNKDMLSRLQMQNIADKDQRLGDEDFKRFDDHLSDFEMEYKVVAKSKINENLNADIVLKAASINFKNDMVVSIDTKGDARLTRLTEKSIKSADIGNYGDALTSCCFSYRSDYIILSDALANIYYYNVHKKSKKEAKTSRPLKFMDSTKDDRLFCITTDDVIELYDIPKATSGVVNDKLANCGISAFCYEPTQTLFNFAMAGKNGQVYFYDYRSNYIDQQMKLPCLSNIDYLSVVNTYAIAAANTAKELQLIDIRTAKIYRTVDLTFMGQNTTQGKRVAVGNNKVLACSTRGEVYSIDIYNDPSVDQVLPISQSPLDYLFYNTQLDRLATIDSKAELSLVLSDLK